MTSAGDTQRLAVLVHEVRSPVAALSAIAETFADESLEGAARLELARLAIAASRGIERVVVVTVEASESHILLSVSDSGAGVPIADQDRIFEAGVRLDANRAGSGLGLAIARAIAEAHGGRLTLTSAPGEGATFIVALPVD